ncbi:MAG: MATE family efflux transporter [Gammaproteobacteria bacterium]|nr:MAG: MATE family efflux transporter [Gammaproteobacteria bacterium]
MMKQSPRFVTGSIWRHVVVMTLTNSVGLMALFVVDLIDLYFLNLLGEQEMAAAVGFSAQLMFYVTAISIGLLIAVGILVSQRIGAKQVKEAKRIVASALTLAAILIAMVSMVLLWYLTDILQWLGAEGRTLVLAETYAGILLPSGVIMVLGMVTGSVLRALGDARRSMTGTLLAAGVNLVLDPLLIFTLDMGISGAAWASVLARTTMLAYAAYSAFFIHSMLVRPTWRGIMSDFLPIIKLAGPAVMTNLATPIGSTFVMTAIARYGDGAVAAYATIGRMIPVAFSVLFALSGAVSPIIGQNYGAGSFTRIRETYRSAVIFAILVVVVVTVVIVLGREQLIGLFNLSEEGNHLLILFCSGLTLFFVADGILFSTNSVFNSLGYPLYSTFFNYAKFFLGVIPSVYLLSHFYGARGVIIGQAVGPVLVTIAAVITCHRIIKRIGSGKSARRRFFRLLPRVPLWPSSSSRNQL